MKTHANISEWPTITRAVFVTTDGAGCVIVDKETDKDAYLYNLNVRPEYRRKGMASRLMDEAEEWCRERGWEWIILGWWSSEAPRWVLEWYGRRGYDKLRGRKGAVFMQKKL